MYVPRPVDTTYIKLNNVSNEVIEKLAENTHDVWAEKKINEGWTFGPIKDARLKRTPCLVPYKLLPESEKEYDRRIVLEILKYFEIIKSEHKAEESKE